MSGFEIRDMTEADGHAVLSIYQEGMDTGQTTFQQTAPAWADFDQRHLATPRLVAVAADDGAVLGWAAGSPVSARPVYRGVVEESICMGSAALRGAGALVAHC
jgi:L-amino acid N-acyltransferase YncA